MKNLSNDFNGSLAEQFVAQELVANSDFYVDKKLYYWLRESKSSNAEIDFLYQKGNSIFPIEVKAGKRGSLKSLHVFMAEKKKDTAIRFNVDLPKITDDFKVKVNINKNISEIKFKFVSFPLYFAGIIDDLEF